MGVKIKTILVTGGCGFIGSNFVRMLVLKRKDYHIINLDKLTYAGNTENTADISKEKNYEFVRGDICDKELVNNLMKRADIAVHFAAESHVDNSIKEPFIFTNTNVLGTHVLLDAAKDSKIEKFIYISTDEVYGSIEQGSFTESSQLKPNSPYSASKAGGDLLAMAYHNTYRLPVIVTRSSNNYGPYQYPEKMIPLFVTNLMEGKKVPVYGKGANIRDWIYVDDNCEAIEFIMNKGIPGEVYNIGGGNEISNLELTKLIIAELNLDDSYITFVKDRLGHDFRYSLDCSKIRKLGWKPKSNFKKGIKETINWYKKNKKWWSRLKK